MIDLNLNSAPGDGKTLTLEELVQQMLNDIEPLNLEPLNLEPVNFNIKPLNLDKIEKLTEEAFKNILPLPNVDKKIYVNPMPMQAYKQGKKIYCPDVNGGNCQEM